MYAMLDYRDYAGANFAIQYGSPMPSSVESAQSFNPDRSFNYEKYTETLARCKSLGKMRLLKAMAFPYLYGATGTMTSNQHEPAEKSSGPRNNHPTPRVRGNVQSGVSGQSDTPGASNSDQREGTDRVRFLSFGSVRISELMLQDFEYIRINHGTKAVELGCGGVEFSFPCETLADAINLFNQTWGLLNRILVLSPV